MNQFTLTYRIIDGHEHYWQQVLDQAFGLEQAHIVAGIAVMTFQNEDYAIKFIDHVVRLAALQYQFQDVLSIPGSAEIAKAIMQSKKPSAMLLQPAQAQKKEE